MGINASLSDMCISCTLLIKATYYIDTYCFNRSRTIQVNWALLNLPVRLDFSSPVDWFLLLFTALTRTSRPSRHFVHRMPSISGLCIPTGDTHITSDMCVGIHISRGYTYHCDTGVRSDCCSFVKVPSEVPLCVGN